MTRAELVAEARAAHHRYLKAKRWGSEADALQWLRIRDSHMRWARIK